MNHEDTYLKWKAANGIHAPKFHAEEEPPMGRHIPHGHRSKLVARPAIEEGKWAHLTNRRQSDNSRKGWVRLTKEQREIRAAMNRVNANKPKGKKR